MALKEKESAWMKMLQSASQRLLPTDQLSGQLGPQENQMPDGQLQKMGQQTSPTPQNNVLAQAPSPESEDDFFDSEPPQLQTVPPSNPPLTAQPTTQPMGTAPQELVPSQPELMDSDAQNALMKQQAWDQVKNYKLPDDSEIRKQMALGEKSYAENQMLQQGEVNQLKSSLANYQSQPQGRDLRPLAALSDMWFGGNLSRVAEQMAPESAAQRAKVMADIQGKIAAAQGQMTKTEMEGMKQKLAQLGYLDERQIKAEEAKMKAMSGMNNTSAEAKMIRALTGQDRLAQSAVKAIHNNPLIQGTEKQMKQIELDIHTINTPGKLTIQILREIEQGVGRAIGGGGSVIAASQIEKIEFDSIYLKLKKLKQEITNNPTDIDSPQVRAQLLETMERLQLAYRRNNYATAQKLLKGAKTSFRSTPHAYSAMVEAANYYKMPDESGHGGGAASAEDIAAISWAKQNPQDPRSQKILQMQKGE